MTYELFLNQKIFMFFVIFRPCNIQSPLCTNVHSIYYTAGRFIVDPSQQITSLHSTAPNLPEFVELDFQPSYWSIRQFGSVELKRN